MSKKKFILDSVAGVGIDDNGDYLILFFTNYGQLAYDTGTKKFELNDIEISSDEYELGNVCKEINKHIKLFSGLLNK